MTSRRSGAANERQLALFDRPSGPKAEAIPVRRVDRWIVAPSSAHAEALLQRAEEAEVTTLALFEAHLARTLSAGIRIAARAIVRLALRSVLVRSHAAEILASSSGLSPADLLDAADAAIGALHAAAVDPATLIAATSGRTRAVAARGALLAELLSEHGRALSGLGLIDARELPSRIARALAAASDDALDEALLGARSIELPHAIGLSPSRLAWIETLHARLARLRGGVRFGSPTAHVSLLGTCGIDDPRELLAARLEERFVALDDAPDLVHEIPGEGEGILAEVAGRLFVEAGDAPKIETGSALRLVSAAGIDVEVAVAAAEAAAALRRGHAPERIVIALPTLDEAIVRPLRRALRAASVPFHEGRGAPPTASRAVASLLSVLRALEDGARKELVVDLLRSGVRRRPRLARALERIAGADLVRDGDAILAALDVGTRAEIAPFVKLLRADRVPKTIDAALARLRAIVEALGGESALEAGAGRIVRSEDPELLDALSADLAAWASFVEAVDDLERAVDLAGLGELPIGWGALAHELEVALEARRLVPGHRAGAVSIARLRDRLGLDADVLILLEVHDGALPARASADPLLSRATIAALRDHDPRRAPAPRALAGAVDLLSAIDAIGRTSSRAVIVHRAVDEDRRRQLPGALPLEIARVTTAAPVAERAFAIPLGGIARAPRDLALLSAYRARFGLEPIEETVAIRAAAERDRARAFAAPRPSEGELDPSATFATHTGDASPLDGRTRAALARKFGATSASPLSVSDAEHLLLCPFLVFAERVCGAKANEPIEDDGGARDAGSLAHRALLEIYQSLHPSRDAASEGARDVPRDQEAIRAVAEAAIDRVFDAAPATTRLQRVRRERLRQDLVTLVLRDQTDAASDGRVFVAGEIGFGLPRATWPPLALEGFHVSGSIDRIDRDRAGTVTVIDYKARVPVGVTAPGFFAERRSGSVQIALYARAVAANLAPPRIVARFDGYRHGEVGLLVGDKSGTIWSEQVGDAAGARAGNARDHDVASAPPGPGAIALALVDQIRASIDGELVPRRNSHCARCAQRVACRVPLVVLEESARDE